MWASTNEPEAQQEGGWAGEHKPGSQQDQGQVREGVSEREGWQMQTRGRREGEPVNTNQGDSEREGGHTNKRVGGGGGLGWVVSAFGQHPTIFFSFHSF